MVQQGYGAEVRRLGEVEDVIDGETCVAYNVLNE